MKRVTDIVLSLLALTLLAPVLLVAAVATVFDSGLPVLFKQIRMGLDGREFGMFKFRSMVKDASSIGPYFTNSNDVRVTRVGRLLRRTSIDELPQIINVLLGDMSLVGPRPDVPAQQSLYAPNDWALRCSVRPGITGLAQVLIRSTGTPQDRLDLDLRYIKEQSMLLDIKIMWLTLARLSGKGSN